MRHGISTGSGLNAKILETRIRLVGRLSALLFFTGIQKCYWS